MSSHHWRTRRQLCRDLALAAAGLSAGSFAAKARAGEPIADRILVLKSQRVLLLMRGERRLAQFPIALGAHPIGPKQRQGDQRTPEGLYHVDGFNPRSRYHRALHISYPNEWDVQRALAAGFQPGGDIEIHGLPPDFAHYDPVTFHKDWTNGCISVSDPAMDAIWPRVALGTPVEIRA
ncbi:MAG TPA: L,D-transpeptidase family protein [Stellaceae bacterium]|nr:L,D-transpeptidase family protein [Stellaceae bacterium]